jgi:hypothetical protein
MKMIQMHHLKYNTNGLHVMSLQQNKNNLTISMMKKPKPVEHKVISNLFSFFLVYIWYTELINKFKRNQLNIQEGLTIRF